MRQNQSGRVFSKRYPDAATTAEVIRRSRIARHGGVITPSITSVNNNHTVEFERIDGECGIELLQKNRLRDLIAPLIELHKIDQDKLPRFDTFLRIDPRVAAFSIPEALVLEIQKRKKVAFPVTGVVHGDFHLGQLIRDSSGKCWIIDLDDMATGSPEADLGNLAAYLATHPATMGDSVSASLRYWENQITGAWNDLGQIYQENWLQYFMHVALIRRTLKRVESGDDSLMGDCMSTLLTPG